MNNRESDVDAGAGPPANKALLPVRLVPAASKTVKAESAALKLAASVTPAAAAMIAPMEAPTPIAKGRSTLVADTVSTKLGSVSAGFPYE